MRRSVLNHVTVSGESLSIFLFFILSRLRKTCVVCVDICGSEIPNILSGLNKKGPNVLFPLSCCFFFFNTSPMNFDSQCASTKRCFRKFDSLKREFAVSAIV